MIDQRNGVNKREQKRVRMRKMPINAAFFSDGGALITACLLVAARGDKKCSSLMKKSIFLHELPLASFGVRVGASMALGR